MSYKSVLLMVAVAAILMTVAAYECSIVDFESGYMDGSIVEYEPLMGTDGITVTVTTEDPDGHYTTATVAKTGGTGRAITSFVPHDTSSRPDIQGEFFLSDHSNLLEPERAGNYNFQFSAPVPNFGLVILDYNEGDDDSKRNSVDLIVYKDKNFQEEVGRRSNLQLNSRDGNVEYLDVGRERDISIQSAKLIFNARDTAVGIDRLQWGVECFDPVVPAACALGHDDIVRMYVEPVGDSLKFSVSSDSKTMSKFLFSFEDSRDLIGLDSSRSLLIGNSGEFQANVLLGGRTSTSFTFTSPRGPVRLANFTGFGVIASDSADPHKFMLYPSECPIDETEAEPIMDDVTTVGVAAGGIVILGSLATIFMVKRDAKDIDEKEAKAAKKQKRRRSKQRGGQLPHSSSTQGLTSSASLSPAGGNADGSDVDLAATTPLDIMLQNLRQGRPHDLESVRRDISLAHTQ